MELNTFQVSDIMEWYTYFMVDHKEDCQTGEHPKSFEPKNWVNWKKSVYTSFYTVLNARYIPLAYAIRQRKCPLENMITINEKKKFNAPYIE